MSSSNNNAYDIETRKVAHAFDDAAKDYDAVSLLQQTVVDRLIESFELIKTNPSTINLRLFSLSFII